MAKYKMDSSRITVKLIDADTEELLLEIPNRNSLNIGEIFSDHMISNIVSREIESKDQPKKLMVFTVVEFTMIE
jgi:uncharacterized FlaG/YvyC family protein